MLANAGSIARPYAPEHLPPRKTGRKWRACKLFCRLGRTPRSSLEVVSDGDVEEGVGCPKSLH